MAPLSNSAGVVEVVPELVVELEVDDEVLLFIITGELVEVFSLLSLPEQFIKSIINIIFNKNFNLIFLLLNFYKINNRWVKRAHRLSSKIKLRNKKDLFIVRI